jgi:localization factor PodJL
VVCTGGGGPGHSRAGRRGLETEGARVRGERGRRTTRMVRGSAAPNTALVTRAQNLLNKLGYDAGMADGLMGAQTRDPIKSFERKNGLEETGKVTIPLVAKLERLTS